MYVIWFEDAYGASQKAEIAGLETAQDVWGLLYAAGYRMRSTKP